MRHTSYFMLVLLAMLLHGPAASAQLEAGQTYRISPVSAAGKSLFVKDASPEVNADVVLWTETDVPAQQWTLGTISTAFTLKNVYTGLYFAPSSYAAGSTTRQVKSATAGRWRIEAVDEGAGIYRIRPSAGSFSLAVSGSDDGAQPALARATDDDSQLWRFVAVEPKSAFDEALRQEVMDKFISAFVKRHGSYRSFGEGGWGNAEMLEVGLDAYEVTGLQKYLDLCRQDYNWFNQNVGALWNHLVYTNDYKWFGHDFNDDVMWQIIAVARLAWLTGETQYLNAARKNFDLIYERAYMPEWGMMRWAEDSGSPTGTNSCIMGPTEVAACYLGMAGAGEEYFEKARALYAKQRERLAKISTGQVYDSFTIDPATGGIAKDDSGKDRINYWASTYNQGTMLGAAVLLYDHYGTEQYRKDADAIARYSMRDLCNSDGIIKVCQVTDGDLCGFKGILMRYMRRYILDLNHPEYAEWLTKNAFRAYNNRTAKAITTSAWLTKSTPENSTNSFSCSTAASAAVNTVFTDVSKDAFAPIPVSQTDYHGGTFAVTTDGKTAVSVKDGTWVVFDNVDFGEQTAQSIALGLSTFVNNGTATVSVCLDSMAGEPVATLTATSSDNEGYVFAPTQPISGIHHVYLRFAYSVKSRTNAYQVASIRFSTLTAEELATGVEEVNGEGCSGAVYDLSGRRISPRQRSIQIVNGKKKLIR